MHSFYGTFHFTKLFEFHGWPLLLLFTHPVLSDSLQPMVTAHQASLSLTIFWSLPKFMFTASVMPSSHLILWHPLLLLPSIFSSIRDFQWVICSHQMTKLLELQLQNQFFQWIFRADFPYEWLVWSAWCPSDFQESSQHHSSKASIHQVSITYI